MMRNLSTRAAALLFAASAAVPFLCAQDVRDRGDWEWEPGEGYHEEEWYDPTDWFDDDSRVDYEMHWDDYYWESAAHDWGYDWPYYDPYEYWHDPYYYDGRFGGDGWAWSQERNRWVPADQNRRTDGGSRSSAGRPPRQQGQQRQQRQEQQQGRDPQQPRGNGRSSQSGRGRPTAPITMQGEVTGWSEVELQGQRDAHTIVRLVLRDGEERLVNLGPRVRVGDLELRHGEPILVQGRRGHIGNRTVLMATRIRTDGRTLRPSPGRSSQRPGGQRSRDAMDDHDAMGSPDAVGSPDAMDSPGDGDTSSGARNGGRERTSSARSQRVLRGTVARWTRVRIGDNPRGHLLVMLTLRDGASRLVNFGPEAELDQLGLDRGREIAIRGPQHLFRGRPTLFARDLRVGGREVRVRWPEDGYEPDPNVVSGDADPVDRRLDGWEELERPIPGEVRRE